MTAVLFVFVIGCVCAIGLALAIVAAIWSERG